MTYRVMLYGRLRAAGDAVMALEASGAITAKEFLKELSGKLDRKLLKGCVLATNDRILLPTERVPRSVSVLPPVCGG